MNMDLLYLVSARWTAVLPGLIDSSYQDVNKLLSDGQKVFAGFLKSRETLEVTQFNKQQRIS